MGGGIKKKKNQVLFVFIVLGAEQRVLSTLGKHSLPELQPHPSNCLGTSGSQTEGVRES